MDIYFEGYTSTGTDVWLTPPYIIEALGEFDLDPCSPINRPWDTAKKHYDVRDDGLLQQWHGRVWCNPPYGKHTKIWLDRCALHQNSIALIFARTETRMFFDYVWEKADALLFLKGRLKFHHADGSQASVNAGAPSVLIAYGKENAEALRRSKLNGAFIDLTHAEVGRSQM